MRRSLPLGLAAVFSVSFYAFGQLGGAQGVDVSYSGYVDQNGIALNDSAVDFVFEIFDSAGAGSACDTVTVTGVTVSDGRFATVIENIDETCIKRKDPHIEVSIDVDQTASPTPLTGRQRLYPAVAAYTSGTGDFDSVGLIDAATLNVRGAGTVNSLTVTNDAIIGDDLTVTSITATDPFALYWGTGGQLRSDQGGSIELGNGATAVPYVDFHGWSTGADYNVRLINSASGVLRVEGQFQVSSNTTVSGVLNTAASLNNNGSLSTYTQTLQRYTVWTPNASGAPARGYVTISESTLNAYCGDEDGCDVTIMMMYWTGAESDQTAASYGPKHFYYAPLNFNSRHTWRTADNTTGYDGNAVVEHAFNLFNTCYFTDGSYALGGGGSNDNNYGMGLLSWNGDYNAACRLIIDD